MIKTANNVQCGVYMINGGSSLNPHLIPFSGDYNALHIPNPTDPLATYDYYYLVYPGFKVQVQVSDNSFKTFDNTTGLKPGIGTINPVNQGKYWKVFYMGIQIDSTTTTLTTNSLVSLPSNIGNTVQSGVYMIDTDALNTYPIPFSGDYNALRVPNDIDNYYIIYPGFKVIVTGNNDLPYTFDATYNTTPQMKTPSSGDINKGSSWSVYYMNTLITGNTTTNGNAIVSVLTNTIGNTIQCGVFMVRIDANVTHPIPFSGNKDDLHVLNNRDDYYLVYPGFCVYVYQNDPPDSNYQVLNNTNGTFPQMLTAKPSNDASYWKVYYMNYMIEGIILTQQ